MGIKAINILETRSIYKISPCLLNEPRMNWYFWLVSEVNFCETLDLL